jgi:hypothetical protein
MAGEVSSNLKWPVFSYDPMVSYLSERVAESYLKPHIKAGQEWRDNYARESGRVVCIKNLLHEELCLEDAGVPETIISMMGYLRRQRQAHLGDAKGKTASRVVKSFKAYYRITPGVESAIVGELVGAMRQGQDIGLGELALSEPAALLARALGKQLEGVEVPLADQRLPAVAFTGAPQSGIQPA